MGIREETLIEIFKEYKEKYGIKGAYDIKKFCKEIGVDENELLYILSYMFVVFCCEMEKFKEKAENLKRENEVLDKCINGYIKNKREKQMALVESGLPIAKNKKKNLSTLDMFINMFGCSDEYLMEYYEISRTTLWRWKKELAEKLDYLEKSKGSKKQLIGNEIK